MKKFLFITILLGLFATTPMYSQTMSIEQLKAQRERKNEARKLLNDKASKDAKKQAKQFKKEGWKTLPGAKPIEKQIDESMLMQLEYDQSGYPLYLWGEASSVASAYNAAKMQSIELAKQSLASLMESEVAALVESSVANNQITSDQASSIVETVSASKSKIAKSFGRIITVVEAYRDTKSKNKEVMVRVAFNHNMALENTKNIVRNELKNKSEELHNKLDEITGW